MHVYKYRLYDPNVITGSVAGNSIMYKIITPRACARGKVFDRFVVHTKITRSRLLGVLASGQYCHDVEKVMIFCFKSLDKDHECYESCFLIGPYVHRPHLLKLISYA